MDKKVPQRLVIYPKDVVNITGKSVQSARRILQKIRQRQGKGKDECITILEFCAYMGIPEAQVINAIKA